LRSRPRRRAGWALLRVVHRTGLADHGDANLPGILQLALDAARDLARQPLRARVVHTVVLDHDAHLAPGLDRVRLLDPREAVGDLLQRLEPLDVDLEALAPRPGPRARDRVGRRDQHRPQAAARVVVVVVADRLEHRRGLAVALRQLHAE